MANPSLQPGLQPPNRFANGLPAVNDEAVPSFDPYAEIVVEAPDGSSSQNSVQRDPTQRTTLSPAARETTESFDPYAEDLSNKPNSSGPDASDGIEKDATHYRNGVRKTDFDPGSLWVQLAGLILAFISGAAFIGFAIWVHTNSSVAVYDAITGDVGVYYIHFTNTGRALVDLALNVTVTVCTESTGAIHATTLRWALIRNKNLDFCANLRLFSSDGKRWSPIGPIANITHLICLILSYVTASMLILPLVQQYFPHYKAISYIPPLILGVTLFIQAFLALAAFLTVKVPTWSNNCFDITCAAIYEGVITPVPGRCLVSISALGDDPDSQHIEPSLPVSIQPSMWKAHPSVRKVVIYTWCLMPLVTLWAVIVVVLIIKLPVPVHARVGTLNWNPIPDVGGESAGVGRAKGTLSLIIGWILDLVPHSVTSKTIPEKSLGAFIIIVGLIQGCLTIGISCCELLVNLGRDENLWRQCARPQGAHLSGNSLVNSLLSWQTVSLLIIKPLVHWLFGNSVGIIAGWGVFMLPVQLLYLALGTILVAIWATIVARHRSRGSQPAAYGHLQTLANLVDDWRRSEDPDAPQKRFPWNRTMRKPLKGRLYWGHKSESLVDGVCHAGTSSHPLPPLREGHRYA